MRLKSFVSVAAVIAVLTIAGARTLHSEETAIGHVVTTATAAGSGPCWFCDTPDCALLTHAIVVAPPRAANSKIVVSASYFLTSFENVPLYIRPPPSV